MNERTLYLAEHHTSNGVQEHIIHVDPDDAKEDIAVCAGYDDEHTEWEREGERWTCLPPNTDAGEELLVVEEQQLYHGSHRGTPYDLATVLRNIDGVLEVQASHHDITVAFPADRHDTVEDIDDSTLDAVARILEPTGFELEWGDSIHDGLERHDWSGGRRHNPIASSHACSHELHACYVNMDVHY